MVRFSFIVVLLLFASFAGAASAQECLQVGKSTADNVAAFVKNKGKCAVSCRGCGCLGGPGYRDDRGRCVGWDDLIEVCGLPPHAKCAAECVPADDACEVGREAQAMARVGQ